LFLKFNNIVSSFTGIANAARVSGFNAKRAEELKRDKYEMDVDRLHMAFVPFIIESCNEVIDKIGRALADIDRIPRSQSTRRFKQRIQCLWMKRLGACLAAQAAKDADL
jgi:hypothetical protein